ncbi:hypothetical protein EGY14_02060 [Burkholderia pseudomallei]|nr:hypothetical protein EGY14_02060 [Burkholderia pseudomallei]
MPNGRPTRTKPSRRGRGAARNSRCRRYARSAVRPTRARPACASAVEGRTAKRNPCPARYYLHAPIIGALASQARHDSRPQSLMIRGVLSPGLVGGW